MGTLAPQPRAAGRILGLSLVAMIPGWARTAAWRHCHAVTQDVLLRIAEIREWNGASIAFPTRTLELKTEPQLAGLAPAGAAEEPSA